MLINRMPKSAVLRGIITVVSLIHFSISHLHAGTVVVKPGQFDHFTFQVPDRLIAGESFVIKIQAYDSNNNLITNFSETGKEFKVDIQGSAVASPSIISAAAFSGGSANITVNSRKAEKIVFALRESGGTVAVISRELNIVPNKLDHFVLQAPSKVTAGANFDVRIIAKDLFENVVDDLNVGRNIKINSSGTSSVKIVGNAAVDFKSGMATAGFVSEKTGNLLIEIQETSSGSRGRTPEIIVLPAALSYFKLQAPRTVLAGEAFELLIAAYDAYDNVVTSYSSVGAGVRLASTGTSKIDPSFVSQSEFREGQATVKVSYEKAEDIQISCRENNREQHGKTSDIQVVNAVPEHFAVITPDSAVSGQRFKIKVEAYDRFNNLAKNFNLIGNNVVLGITGSGTISPPTILPSEFVNGVAMVDIIYDKAESFQISARMAPERSPGRITVKEQEAKREVPQVREISKVPEKVSHETRPVTEAASVKKEPKKEVGKKEPPAKKPAQPKKDQASAQKTETRASKEAVQKQEPAKKEARQKTETAKKEDVKKEIPQKPAAEIPARAVSPTKEVVEKKPESLPKQEPVKKTVEKSTTKQPVKPEVSKAETAKKEAITEKKAAKDEKKPVQEPSQMTTEKVQAKLAVKPEVSQTEPAKKETVEKKEAREEKKPLQETKQPAMELAKREEKKIEKPSAPPLFSVSNVSIIEAKNKAMLVINITNPNGHLEYSDVIESKYGKEWLKLKIKPAIRKSEKLYKFKSAFVGDVMVEENKSEKDTLDIFIEMIPSGITFDIARIKNTLVVTLSQP